MNKAFVLCFLLAFGGHYHYCFGQRCDYVLEGIVYDYESNNTLSGANIWIEQETTKGVSSREDGTFTLSDLCGPKFHLNAHFIGYSKVRLFIDLNAKNEIKILLKPEKLILDEVVIHGKHSDVGLQKSETVMSSDISEQIGKGISEIIESIGGVHALKTGSGISKPIIHGLSGNRVRLLNNEIPQSGQYWGNDHAPEIDPSIADHISVIKGASALMYGSSSLGGVVLVEPGPILSDPHVHGKALYKFNSNGLGHNSSFRIEQSNSFVDWRVSSSFKKFGDRKTPDYFLTNTSNKEIDFALQLQKKFKHSWRAEAYYSFFNSKIGILRGAHIGNLTDLGNALTQETPFFTSNSFSYSVSAPRQQVQHHLLKAKILYRGSDKFNVSLTYGGQLNDRKEFDVRRGELADRPSLSIQQLTNFFDARLKWFLRKNKKLYFGIQATAIDNKNDNAETNVLPLIPDYDLTRVGTFLIFKHELSPFRYELGLRYDRIEIDANVISTSIPRVIENFKPQFNNLSFSGGLQWDILSNLETTLSIGYVSRSPEPNELYSNGLHQGVSGIEIGNPNLNNEQSLKSTLALDWEINKRFSIHLLPYYQRINNFVFLEQQPGFNLTIRGAFLEYKYSQADARFSGLDASLQAKPGKRWQIVGKYSTVQAINLESKEPLPFIPTDQFRSDITFSLDESKRLKDNKIGLSFEYVWEASSKNTEIFIDFVNNRTIEVAPPNAYSLIHIKGQTKYHWKSKSVKLWITIENALNQKYRDYLNRHRYFADALGRSIQLGAQFQF